MYFTGMCLFVSELFILQIPTELTEEIGCSKAYPATQESIANKHGHICCIPDGNKDLFQTHPDHNDAHHPENKFGNDQIHTRFETAG